MKLKRVLAVTVASILSLSLVGPLSFSAKATHTEEYDTFDYTADDGNTYSFKWSDDDTYASVTGIVVTNLEAEIPSEVPSPLDDGTMIPITEIAPYAFEDSEITSVLIPNSIVKIEEYAFNNCAALRYVNFQWDESGNHYGADSHLEEVASYAFANCCSLRTISFPCGVKSIGDHAFQNCTSLGAFGWGSGSDYALEYFGVMFDGCTSLLEVIVPSSVKRIASNAITDWAPDDAFFDIFYDLGGDRFCIAYDGTLEEFDSMILVLGGEYDPDTWESSMKVMGDRTPSEYFTEVMGFNILFLDSNDVLRPGEAKSSDIPDNETGDVDLDGSVTAIDAHYVLVAYASEQVGQDTGLTDEQMALADVDGDGVVTAIDAHYILVYYATQQVREGVTWDDILS